MPIEYSKKHNRQPCTIVLYSWFVPCLSLDTDINGSCIQKLKEEADKLKVNVILAHTTKITGCQTSLCSGKETQEKFKDATLELMKINDYSI